MGGVDLMLGYEHLDLSPAANKLFGRPGEYRCIYPDALV
jgi:hypothetical protein